MIEVSGACTESGLKCAPSVAQYRFTFSSRAFPLLQNQQGMEVAAKQDASAESRKALMEAVKNFKRLPDEERAAAINGLMKVFQDEVDALTRRARFSEKAFLSLWKDLMEAPDPTPLIANAADSARTIAKLIDENAKLTSSLAAANAAANRGSSDQAAEIERLRSEVTQLEDELGKLSNQDITIRELEDRINEFESTIESQVTARLAERESELRKIFDSELEDVREAEMGAEGRVAALQAALAEAVAQRDEAQAQAAMLFEGSGGGGGVGSSGVGAGRGGGLQSGAMVPAAEVEVLSADNERLAARVATLQAELAEMQRRLAGSAADVSGADGSSSSSSSLSSLDPFSALRAQADAYRARTEAAEEEITRLSGLLAQAQEEGRRWGTVLDAQRSSHEAALAEVTSRLTARDADVSALRAELASRPTDAEVAGLKQRVSLLRAMAFAATEEDEDEAMEQQQQQQQQQPTSLPSAGVDGAGGDSSADAEHGLSGGTGDVSASAGSPSASAAGAVTSSSSAMGDVHSLMLRRIRQLEGRLVRAETARQDAEAELAKVTSALTASRDTQADQADLIRRLEEALATQTGGAPSAAVSVAAAGSAIAGTAPSTPAKGTSSSSAASVALMSPELQLESILQRQQQASAVGGGLGRDTASDVSTPVKGRSATGDGGADVSVVAPQQHLSFADGEPSSMVAILRGQRDRFRQRMLELEAEATARTSELAEARGAVSRLTSDNVKLYEKIRYLQSFLATSTSGGGGASRGDEEPGDGGGDDGVVSSMGGAGRRGGGLGQLTSAASSLRSRAAAAAAGYALGGEDDFEGPYKRMYNETMDPFADFHRRERARQYQRLSPAEKITLSSSRFFLSNKLARNFVFFYVLALHLLVFATLWHFAHVSHRGCAEDVHDHHDDGLDASSAASEDRAPGITRLLPNRFRGTAAAAATAAVAVVDAVAPPDGAT